jgi:hypothetical protein
MTPSDHIIIIQIHNEKAMPLIKQLESLELITILEENVQPAKPSLSAKYRGKLPAEVYSSIQTSQILKQIDGY